MVSLKYISLFQKIFSIKETGLIERPQVFYTVIMKCDECGSFKIKYDPFTEDMYCRDCGIVVRELKFA